MAKVKFGAMVQDARGAMDGVVYSKNQYGAYVRQKVSPVQPQTARQTLVRERLSTLAKRFSSVITQAQRDAWAGFARVNPISDVFGDKQSLSGVSSYVRLNSVILNCGGALIDVPPADLGVRGLLSAAVVMDTALAGSATLTFTDTPLGPNEALYLYATQGMNAGVQFFKPALRFVGCTAAGQASPFDALAFYTAKFGSMIKGTAVGWTISVADISKGAVSPGLFVRTVVL
jgi:hypothetical protein